MGAEVVRRADTSPAPGLLPKSKHRPVIMGPRAWGMDGMRVVFRFDNGYGASLVHGYGSYGYEIAVTSYPEPTSGDDDFDLDGSSPIGRPDDPIIGWLDPQGIEETLDAIAALPPKSKAVES